MMTLENATSYKSVVDALQYLTLTHVEIAFVVNKVSQFMHKVIDFH